MKILVIGSGGREHAICWKLAQSQKVTEIFAAPGNPGMAECAENVAIKVDQFDQLLEFGKEKNIDLVVVGPEYPLSLGISDEFRKIGIKVFGPSKQAAQLESSKIFAKEIMTAAGVPTAAYKEFSSESEALKALSEVNFPIVVKADGLAAGKGVIICKDKDQATLALDKVFNKFSSNKVLLEDFIPGIEASYIVATDGKSVVPMAASHDYKRLNDSDQGPNTGGMGTVCPTPRLSMEKEQEVLEQIIKPVISEMNKRGISFNGFLYAGLMLSDDGSINVLEFNARMGDPECQVILPRLESDFAGLLYSLASQAPYDSELSWNNGASVCVVMSSEGYPDKPRSGDSISGISEINSKEGLQVFHAGTGLSSDGKLITSGGRVLNVVGSGESLQRARELAYQGIEGIDFRGSHYRKDIGLK